MLIMEKNLVSYSSKKVYDIVIFQYQLFRDHNAQFQFLIYTSNTMELVMKVLSQHVRAEKKVEMGFEFWARKSSKSTTASYPSIRLTPKPVSA